MQYRDFLKTTLPHLGLRWRRFRGKAHRRRIGARLQTLGFSSLAAYRSHLLADPKEQRHLAALLSVTISRFWRNRQVFEKLADTWLPLLLEQLAPGEPLQVWSAGCASGEEPYSLLILWRENFAAAGRSLHLLATDANRECLERARHGCYPASSFREMPLHLRQKYCSNRAGIFSVASELRREVAWLEHNLIWDPPLANNHLIFCRNLAYTYFTVALQQEITRRFYRCLLPGGLLVVGRKDRLPAGSDELFRLLDHPVYQKDLPRR